MSRTVGWAVLYWSASALPELEPVAVQTGGCTRCCQAAALPAQHMVTRSHRRCLYAAMDLHFGQQMSASASCIRPGSGLYAASCHAIQHALPDL